MEQLFSPWRSKYIASFKDASQAAKGKSIFADIPPEEDEARLVVYRGKTSFVIMNLYPYNAGHVMIVPYKQTPTLSDLNSETRLEIMNLIDLSIQALTEVLSPHGFNVGLNLGSVAGGSVDSHLHFHVVPRWHGDTNFMPVIADTKVISNDMQELYYKLRSAMQQLSKSGKTMTAPELMEALKEAFEGFTDA
ncbi:MAG: HIT domain-containing protein [Chloroherpetonaceae bacterium]|nr:HIT domain-containing protein [Chloroherpetonaceae bacterium]